MADETKLTFGSLAYDPFNSAVPEFDLTPEEAEQPPREAQASEAQPRPRQRVRIATPEDVAARAAARVRARVFALVTIPLAAACLIALVLLLQAHTRLTAISSEASRLETRIADLEAERARLQIRSESAFHMDEVEQTARTVIGMIKADADQAVYLRSTSEDVAMILSTEGQGPALLRRARDFFRRVQAYFTQERRRMNQNPALNTQKKGKGDGS